MTLIEHLTELRTRIIRSLIAIAPRAVVAWFLYPHIFDLLIHPYRQVIETTASPAGACSNRSLEGLAIRMKISAYGGVMFAMPVICTKCGNS